MSDIPLWLICGSFAAWEIYARFVARNKHAHTLSNRVWALEHEWPWVRAVIAIACLLLALHLTVHWI